MSVSMCERTSVSSLGRGIPTHLPVTEDTPPDYLEGHMQLLCVLPNGKCVDIAVERRTPMMDVLVQICTSRRLAPGDHVLSLTDTAKQNLPFKPSTPIGSLDAHTIHVVAKSRELSNGKVSWPSLKAAQPFEPTIRLQVHLPRNQLHVLRVSPRSTLAEILHTVCEVKALDPDLCEIRHPTNVDERLRLSCSLADYKLQEITIALRDNSPPLSVADLPAMQSGSSKSLCRPTSEVAAYEKKKKGIFGFVFGKKSPRQNGTEFRSPSITDESPMKSETPVKNESPVNKESPAVQASRNSPPRGGRETNGTDMPPPHPPTRIKKRPAPAPPPGSKSSPNAPVIVNGNSGSHPVKEEEKASSVISSSSSTDKSGCPIHSRQGSDSSSGCHESSLVSEREPTQKSLGTSSLSDVAAPPRLRPKLTPGVGQSPRAVSVINLSHSSALHSGPSSNLTKTQSHSHTSLTSASKKRKAPAPPPISALSSSTVSASATTTTNTTTPTSSVGAGTASHRSSLTDSTVSATSSSIVSSFVAVSTDRTPSRSSNSSAAPVGEKVTVRPSEPRKVESQQPQPQPLPRASSVAKSRHVDAISSQKNAIPAAPQTPPIPSPRKKTAPASLQPLPVDDDLEIDDWSLFQQKRESFSSSSTIPSLAPPPKPRRQWQVPDDWPRGPIHYDLSTTTAEFSSSDDVASVESLRTKQVRQLKKAFNNPDWNSPPSDNQKPTASFPTDVPKLTIRRHSNVSNGASKNCREDMQLEVSLIEKKDVCRRKLRKRSSREVKEGQHVLRYSTRKYSTPSTPSSSESEDSTENVAQTKNKYYEKREESLFRETESIFPRCASDGNFWQEDLGSDSTSMAASDTGPVTGHSDKGVTRKTMSYGQSEQSLGLSRWEKVEVSDLSAWFDDIFNGGGETGPRSDTSSEFSCRDKGTKNLIYRESSAESGEDGIYERVRPMSKVLSERKPVIEATENQPIEALYSVVVKKPKGIEVLEKNENNFRESVERVNGHQLEPIEALPEKEQEEFSEDYIAWEYKLPEPPTPFQDTPIISNLEPMTSASESPSRSLSPDSLSDTTTVTMPLVEEPVRKDVTDAVQDLKWDVGETRTEPEEVEEEVIVPIEVKKSPKILIANATEDEPILVLTEKINEESQTDDNSLELRSDLKEKTESVLDEADQRQETPEAIADVNCHVVEEKNIREIDDPKISEEKDIQKTEAKDVEASPPKTRTERKEEREEITEEALDLSLKHFENVAVTEHPAPVKETPSSSNSSSRKSSVFSHSDNEEDTDHIRTIQQPEMSSTDAASSSGNATFPPVPFTKTSTEKYLESSLDDERNRELPPQDKDEKRGSVSSLQKSESLALPSRPKILKRQASFGANDQELAKGTEISAVTSRIEQMLQHTTEAKQELLAQTPNSDTECVPSSVETITAPATLTKTAEMPVAPPTSTDTAQPVNLELFMQAQQLFSKAAENMGNQQLQEEFIRLQQQFLSWQQQLLTNQQVLQSKLSQSLQAELPKESSASQEKMGEIVEKELEEPKQPVTVEAKREDLVEEPSIAASTDKQVWKTCRSFEERLEKKIPSLREESTKKIDIVEEVQVVQEKTTIANVVEQPTKLKTEDKMSEKPAIEVEKPVTNAITSSENQVPKEPIYRYQGPPTIKLEPWRPGRPKSEIIDFSRDASFFLPDQLAQSSETRKSVRELVQQSKLELLIKPPTLPKPSDVKILQSQSSVAPESKLKVVKEEPKVIVKEESKVIFKEEPKVIVKGEFKVTQENQAQTKPILTKQMTLPSTALVTSKSHDVPSPVTPNQPPAYLAPPSAAANVPFRPTLVRRASIGTPKPFELKPAPLRKMQFPIRVPEVRGFAPLKPDVLLSQNPSPANTIVTTNPKSNNPMRDKLIVSARRPSAELKPLEMEELGKLSEKTATISPPGPTSAPVPTPPTLPTLRPTPLHKPVMIPKTGLDPREELMIAIRSFSANGGLRKNGNSVLLSGS